MPLKQSHLAENFLTLTRNLTRCSSPSSSQPSLSRRLRVQRARREGLGDWKSGSTGTRVNFYRACSNIQFTKNNIESCMPS